VRDVPLIAEILGYCHILGELSNIGTGEVCRAMNQKLRRDVAIKLLSKESEKDSILCGQNFSLQLDPTEDHL
jgi:hypothetical protein